MWYNGSEGTDARVSGLRTLCLCAGAPRGHSHVMKYDSFPSKDAAPVFHSPGINWRTVQQVIQWGRRAGDGCGDVYGLPEDAFALRPKICVITPSLSLRLRSRFRALALCSDTRRAATYAANELEFWEYTVSSRPCPPLLCRQQCAMCEVRGTLPYSLF